METKDIILELRAKKGMSQEELAEKVFVTRQAVSRWETGETVPNTETLKQLSKLFDVSINTLLGLLRQLVCECFGIAANMDFLLVRTYEENGENPELVMYKKRQVYSNLDYHSRKYVKALDIYYREFFVGDQGNKS